MQPFLKTETFKTLNVGFALDEGIKFSSSPIKIFTNTSNFYTGLANPTEAFTVFYGERTILCK